jgi:DNA-directed RNA polymerase specialized sigma24 family protein
MGRRPWLPHVTDRRVVDRIRRAARSERTRLYRDGSKLSQPLATTGKEAEGATTPFHAIGQRRELTAGPRRCIYTAMVRTQLFLDEALHARLRSLARKQGRTVSDLVRETLARAFGRGSVDERKRTLRAIVGLWQDRKDIGSTSAYVRRLRRDTRPRRLKRH